MDLRQIAGDDGLARARARVAAPLVARDGVHLDPEAELGPELAQQREVPARFAPKRKFSPTTTSRASERPRDELAREVLGLPGGERRVEASNVDPLDAQRSHELGPRSKVVRSGGAPGPTTAAPDAGRTSARAVDEPDRRARETASREDGLVAEMHAVEVSDDHSTLGHGRRARLRRVVLIPTRK